jgi:pimeloyl-ACP methyl ester carboxylesterase
VVSTVSDLNTFARALINGDLFEQQATLSLMLAWVQDEGGIFYGLGLERFTLHGVAFIGHSGFWGANLYYLPELDTTIALWINQAQTDSEPYLIRVLDALARAGLAMPASPLETFTEGENMPVVVFETGLGDEMDEAWESVFFDVADFTTAFAYNRRGYGDSEFAFPDATSMVRSGLEVVEDLRQTLQSEQLQPPYVLVGHSIGGGTLELFAKLYPEEVAGVVFIDPRPAGYSNACVETLGLESCNVPEEVLAVWPDVIRAEYLGFKETEQLIASLGGFGDIPVIVLSRTQPTNPPEELAALTLWQDMLRAMAAQSTNGTYLAVPGAGHFIQDDAPETVIQSIQQLVMQARN